jgi:hypothetical protein
MLFNPGKVKYENQLENFNGFYHGYCPFAGELH